MHKKMIRLWLERVRKQTKKSLNHWFTTEKGGKETEGHHLHGIVWNAKNETVITKLWQYGFTFIGSLDRKRTRLNSSNITRSRMPSSA